MGKIAFVFPGQGAQKVGMGLGLTRDSEKAAEMFRRADEILGFSISKLCFEGPDEELKQTVNTQPAIFVHSMAVFEVLGEKGIRPQVTAGHSVGEYAALAAAGVLDFEEALRLVKRRGELMQQAAVSAPGTMAAIIGLDYETIKKCCMEAYAAGYAGVANFNAPDQIVITGETAAVERAMELAKARGAKRAMLLNVGAAFHSKLMAEPAEILAGELDGIAFRDARIPVAVNVSAKLLTDAGEIKEALRQQMLASVLWVDSVRAMVEFGADVFVEAGPGKALSGMIRKIDSGVRVLNAEDTESLAKTADALAAPVS